jgi:spore coat protein H
MTRKILSIILAIIGGIILILIAIMSLSTETQFDEELNLSTLIATPASVIAKETPVDINELPFQDNMALYEFDDPGSVVYMYVTVRSGNSSDNTDHTWEEINDITKLFLLADEAQEIQRAEAILQIGDENGPLPGELGYGAVIPNATIQVRGSSTSLAPQKSFKIELFNNAGFWRGQGTIALNKHVSDITRVKNKLCFDLIKEIPNLVSLRTQFVHLFVKDETGEVPSEIFEDYGLFTQVEQPNTRFLRNHVLDYEGQLYKANFFEFFRYEDQLKLIDDTGYDFAAFERILETKGNRDHSKILQMLDELNDEYIPIELTFEKYFDPDNYFTWLAFNILVGNVDTRSQNFYLYSPKNGIKWYFLPWDYDGSLSRLDGRNGNNFEYWEHGISNYWGVVLHRRVLKVEKYREMLDEKVNELHIYMSPARIEAMLQEYRQVVEPVISSMPDLYYLPGTIQEYRERQNTLANEIQINYDLYLESREKPMPFFLGTPKWVDEELLFNWDESYSFDAQNIVYKLEISRNWEFTEVIISDTLTNFISVQIGPLEPGNYFWRVTATNENGKIQHPFDYFRDAEGNIHSGMKYLYISSDGEVIENEIQE